MHSKGRSQAKLAFKQAYRRLREAERSGQATVPSAHYRLSDQTSDRMQIAASYAFSSAWKPDGPIRQRQAFLLMMRRQRTARASALSKHDFVNPPRFFEDLVARAIAEQISREDKEYS